ALLQSIVQWRERRNMYSVTTSLLTHSMQGGASDQESKAVSDLESWGRLWGTSETGSAEARVRCSTADLDVRIAEAPEKLAPADFRLRPDSPGKGAGADGRDLGADVDLVGPGPAYERWKKTPEYQQWLKDTGQLAAQDRV